MAQLFGVNMNKVPMTTNGAEQLKDELKKLKSIDRPKITKAIKEAREKGDLKENAEYHAAREEQSFVEGRIGVGMNTDHTLEEVGLQFSVTRERIRQIEAKALRKLKHPSRSKQLKSFLES